MIRFSGVVALALAAPLLSGCVLVFAVVEPPGGASIPAPAGAATANVSFVVDASTSVAGVAGTVVDAGGNQVAAVSLVNSGRAPATRHQNSNEWRATLPLAPGSYTFRAVGSATQGTRPSAPRAEAAFQVTSAAPRPVVTLSLTSPAGDILVPRGGTTALGFDVGQTATTGPVTLSATGLPAGVTLAPPAPTVPAAGGTTQVPAALAATAMAAGSATAHFTARSAGAADATVRRKVKVVPRDGRIRFLPAPFLTPSGPPVVASPDGAWRATASRTGNSRVWTFRIARTAGPSDSLDVTFATWPLAGGSNIGGLLFCPGTPTTTALVLSDEDERDPPPDGRSGVTYRAKLIRLGPSGPPQPAGELHGLTYRNAVRPELGFSPDCSIVGAWSISATNASERQVLFANGLLPGATFGGWTFADQAQAAAPTFTANLASGRLVLTGPSGQGTSFEVP